MKFPLQTHLRSGSADGPGSGVPGVPGSGRLPPHRPGAERAQRSVAAERAAARLRPGARGAQRPGLRLGGWRQGPHPIPWDFMAVIPGTAGGFWKIKILLNSRLTGDIRLDL